MGIRNELIKEAFLKKEQIYSFVFSIKQQNNLIKGEKLLVATLLFYFEEMMKITQSDSFINKLKTPLDDFNNTEIKTLLNIYKNNIFKKFVNKTEEIYQPIFYNLNKSLSEISKKQAPID